MYIYNIMQNIVNILIVATAENRRSKIPDQYNNNYDLINEEIIIFNDYSSELDNNKDEYFKIITQIYSYDFIIKYKTISPSFYSDVKETDNDNPNYLGHIDALVADINIEDHSEFFDCILVTRVYSDIYNQTNILTFDKILKKNGIIITTQPKGIYELLSSNYKHYYSGKKTEIGKFNIFIKS
jgi:hypothetical protein